MSADVRPAPVDLSYTRLRTYERCPWLFHLVYDEGWRTGPNAPQALGHSLHRALAAYAKRPGSLNDLLESLDAEWVNEGFAGPQETMEAYEKAREALRRFHEAEAHRRGEIIAGELDIEIPLTDQFLLRASIDRVDRRPDGSLEVIEYKSNDAGWDEERIQSDLQMTIYDLAVRAHFETEDVALTYHFLFSGRRVSTTRTERQREDARARLLTAGAAIAARRYPANPASCERCEFRKRCTNAQKKT